MRYAYRIECFTASGGFAGTDGEGQRWSLSREELIQAIESGRMTCYVTIEGHSHLVTLKAEGAGAKCLATFMGELEALPLPVSS